MGGASLEADCSRAAVRSQPGRAEDLERPVSRRQSVSWNRALARPDTERPLGPEAQPQTGAAGALEEVASETGEGGSTQQQLPQGRVLGAVTPPWSVRTKTRTRRRNELKTQQDSRRPRQHRPYPERHQDAERPLRTLP